MAEIQRRPFNVSDANLDTLVSKVSAERLMEYNRTIAQWERLSGTDDERKAFDYVEETLKRFGLRTSRYQPICLVSLPKSASLTLNDTGETLPCITHSFSVTTGSDGVVAEVVYVGAGTDADYQGKDVRGKIALTDGLAGPAKVGPSERAGAAAVINANPAEVHEMIVSPVWGSPDPDNVDQLPTIPHVSVDGATGQGLKDRLESGELRARITTAVDTGWRPLPVLVASLEASEPTNDYVLLSGHIDSWYYGAMDNGSANASMIEAARILAEHRGLRRRALRVAFWSGHSHARYGTSAWFADEFWQDLHDHCVAHVNIDSPGGRGATVLTEANTMAETYDLAKGLIGYLTDQELNYRRIGRMGDQSFWGVGIPSLYCSISSQPADTDRPDTGPATGGSRRRSGGLGWWWHTPDDTLDKLDPDFLVRDCKILLATVYRVAADQVLPFDQTSAVEEIQRALADIAQAAGDAFDLDDVLRDATALHAAAEDLNTRREAVTSDHEARRVNQALVAMSRNLIPVNYTRVGPFDQDPALGSGSLPGLRAATELARLPEGSHERYLLLTTVRRERNRARAALIEARRAVEGALE